MNRINLTFSLGLFFGNFVSHFILGKSMLGCFTVAALSVVIFLVLDKIVEATGVYKR